ncbi:Rho1 guanine nucleotide exchange factor 1 [Psilocybe cubensis]|uniref:Rho1 guanine nucleotide exchange factor 1 n=2 Tax=Psilocybe cubensis TaxID=181762 RepID=A0A8H7XRT4_PSICU|nr:Rho1 guanine nucleotide exchange factor 1 [Psilocybe cubensis]KAH9479317.1 Rho1 guanine nucleotide exchange factor 1 [Psilocybe cubensis]
MSPSSGHNARSASPVEEDLQRLYNEVWAQFSEETPSSERDLENIYNGYADDNYPSQSSSAPSNPQLKPPARYTAGLPPSPRPVNTKFESYTSSPTSATSPTGRRRLPPTPGSSTSSTYSPVKSYPMPEPVPYRPSGSSQDTYSPISAGSLSAGGPSIDNRKAAIASDINFTERALPSVSGYSNDYTQVLDDGQRTPISSDDYRPHGSLSSYSTAPSFTTQLGSTSSSGTSHTRPSGASPPALPPKPSTYNDSSTRPSYSENPFNAYDLDDREVDYKYQTAPNTHSSRIQHSSHPSAPPPLPPKIPTNGHEQYSSYPQTTTYAASPIALSPYDGSSDFAPKNVTGSATKNNFFDNGAQLISPQAGQQPEAGPSRSSDRNSREEDNWDPDSYTYDDDQEVVDPSGGPSNFVRRPTDMLKTLADYSGNAPVELLDDPADDYWEDEDEEDEARFVNFSLLSHIAMQLRDKVPRGTHVKGSIPYPRAFTGKDIVSTIQTQIQRELAINHGVSTNDRRVALHVARSLQSQLFFYEVEWGGHVLQDGVEDVYMFLDDVDGASDAVPEREELPTGVITMLTRCYSPSCGDGIPCYSYTCPRKGNYAYDIPAAQPEVPVVVREEEWSKSIDPAVIKSLPASEISRQNIIHKLIDKEKQYIQDLDLVESVFIKPLRAANPPIFAPDVLEDVIDDIFGNILDLRECNRRLLEVMNVRQREEGPIILRIGDIFLQAAAEFRFAYPTYIGHYPISEKRLKDEMDSNSEFRLFLEASTLRPEHLQKYPVLLEAVLHETVAENSDGEFLVEAIEAIKNLQSISQLRTFQAAMGKGTPGKWEWHDIVSTEIREHLSKKEQKRQAIIFELIKGEMAYVKDLENIYNIYIVPLRSAEPPIIARDRLEQFIHDVFHNYDELYEHHKKLVDNLHEIQREQHPQIRTITAALFDAALNFREAYMEYIPNYPIAAYRIDDEMANNLPFKTFVDQCVRHPDAHRLDMKNFINRPIPRLLRYELLLKGIMEETPEGHDDHEAIPQVIDVIKALGKESEPGVFSAKQKVEVWRYNANLVFKPGEAIDMDLLDQNRSLIHSGKLLRQPDSGLEWNGWSELHVLLFDNYLVMTKTKEKDGVTKYQVNRRPIPLDLLTLVNFTDPPTQRSAGILRNLRGGEKHDGASMNPGLSPESATDSRSVYPLTLHHNGRTGGPYILYAESAQIRAEWKAKLEDALGLRKAVQESNKVFEIEYLSRDTFIMPSIAANATGPAWNQDNQYTGKVTCSVPFNTPDGRALVAIGCTEGVWIGFRHDPKSIRRVLHLKMVTQCAMLEDFGIFLVLADKALFAYHIEALVPSSPHGAHTSQVPQKLSGTKDVHFFSVGTLQGRTLIIYMKKKSLNSIFRVLEPVGDKINEGVKAPAGFGSRLGFRSTKSEWFRIYRDFFLPSDSFDVIFLKARIAIFCAKGFEIMNLHDFDSITIPQREDPRHAQLAKRCESARPLGMFRSTDEEFLLCYDEFGLYVDKHGDPCRSFGTIEWEGTAERVAFHSPYILLFDSRFIEIRHVETGRLAQIISGNEVRCTWDGRGVSPPVTNTVNDLGDDSVIQEAQVHFVMNSTDSTSGPGGMRTRNIVQHVCELIPTIPLYPSGTPSSAISPAGSSGQPGNVYGTYTPGHVPSHSYASSFSAAHHYAPSQAPSSASTAQYYSPTHPPHKQAYAPVPLPSNGPAGNAYYSRDGYFDNTSPSSGTMPRR